MIFDCIIIGAGPAGGTAAYHLARRGHSVLVLEKELLPRHKPCGGMVPSTVARWFDFDLTPMVKAVPATMRYSWCFEDPLEIPMPAEYPIWCVRRDLFDRYLVRQAQAAGAELRESAEVIGIEPQDDAWLVRTTHGAVYRGRYLIAADGAKGPTAKWLGFSHRKRRLAATLDVDIPAQNSAPYAIVVVFGMVRFGYLWNIARSDGNSIGAGAMQGSGSQDFHTLLAEFAHHAGLDLSAGRMAGHPVLAWNGEQPLHTYRALLAGEAACLIDPLTQEGIRPSIYSGVLAADAIAHALDGDADALPRYSRTLNDTWGAEMAWAQRIGSLFFRFPRVAYDAIVKYPPASTAMVRIACGELQYSDAVSKVVKRLVGK